MPNNQGSSFIPKAPIKTKAKPKGVRKVYIMTYVSFVFFVGVMVASAGVWFFQLHVKTSMQNTQQQLSEERGRFPDEDYERIRELDTRMRATSQLFNRNISLVPFFVALENNVVDKLLFTDFEYERSVGGGMKITASAVTEDFNSALYQREVFANHDVLSSMGIDSVTLETVSGVRGVRGTTVQTLFTSASQLAQINEGEQQVVFEFEGMPKQDTLGYSASLPHQQLDFDFRGEGIVRDEGVAQFADELEFEMEMFFE